MPEPDYSTVTDEEFKDALADLLNEHPAASLLIIPGIYEILSEHFNNEILDRAIENRV